MSEAALFLIIIIGIFVMALLIGWLVGVSRRVSHLEATMVGIKSDMLHLPTKDDVGRIERRLEAVSVEIRAAREADERQEAAIDRLYQSVLSLHGSRDK